MRPAVLVLCALIALPPAGPAAASNGSPAGRHDPLSEVVADLEKGRLVLIRLDDGRTITGRLVERGEESVVLDSDVDSRSWTVPRDGIVEIWTRGTAVDHGYKIGATTVGVIGTVFFGLIGAALAGMDGDTDDDLGAILGIAGAGGIAGAIAGGLAGAGIGLMFPRWHLAYPDRTTLPAPTALDPEGRPVTHDAEGEFLGPGYPGQAGRTDSHPDFGLGIAREARDGAPSARAYGHMGLTTPVGDGFLLGPEFGFAATAYTEIESRGGTRTYRSHDHSWHAAFRIQYLAGDARLRPYLTATVGWYFRGASNLGYGLGGGLEYGLGNGEWALRLDYRYSAVLDQDEDGTDVPLHVLSLGLRFF